MKFWLADENVAADFAFHTAAISFFSLISLSPIS
jgi:hypothetical protein